MKYNCLVLDHDDTVVDSTATIHFPCFIEYLKLTRPGTESAYTLESYLEKNFSPGVEALFLDELSMTEEEFLAEQEYWSEYVKGHIPRAYEGMREIIKSFLDKGGTVAVVSHSYVKYIKRDYEANNLPLPNEIYGWDLPKECRKPSPYALYDLCEKYGFKPSEILVVDDLKPGYDMAKAAGADFACAGWGYDVPVIEEFMRKNCDYYCKTVEDLRLCIENS